MTSSAIAVIALTSPVLADVTPAEVWQNWVDYYKANGYTVTEGARNEAGETLSLTDVVVAFAIPDDEGKVQFTMPEITLTGTGDGKVRTVISETSPMKVAFKNDEDETVELDGSIVMKDAEIVTSGAAADMTHETRAGEIALVLDSLTTAEGKKPLPVTLKLLNTSARQHFVEGDVTRVDATMTADRAELSANIEGISEDEPDSKVSITANMDALNASTNMALPKGVDLGRDMNAALKAGLSLSGTMTAGAVKFDAQFSGKEEDGEAISGSAQTEGKGFDLSFAMGTDGLKYQGSADASSTQFTSTDLPFPVKYAIEGGTFDFQFPVMKNDAPAPFKLAYSLNGLTLGDEIWSLFDAEKVLPRDPASLDVDVTGMVKVMQDLFDPATMKAMEDADEAAEDDAADALAPDATAEAQHEAEGTETPGTDEHMHAEEPDVLIPTEFTVNKLALSAAGAKVDVSGALTIPEGGSIDAPVGKLTARLDGVNGLLDNLVKLGLIPEDQVSGARMMLAMFAKPAPEGGDALIGEYEFKESGEIFANGQQVK